MSQAKISREDVLHMAGLCRLAIDEADVDRFAGQLSNIVAYMDVLNEVDTTGVEPLYSTAEHPVLYRRDEASHARTREEILSNAPERDENYFIVPRIV